MMVSILSFMADRHICYQDIKEEIDRLSIPYLEKFDLYDLFAGSSVPKGKISLSIRFVFRHPQMAYGLPFKAQGQGVSLLEIRMTFLLKDKRLVS